MHVKLNRTLSTIALLLGIVLMGTLVYAGVMVAVKANQLSDALSNLGDSSTSNTSVDPSTVDPAYPSYDLECDYEGGPSCTDLYGG